MVDESESKEEGQVGLSETPNPASEEKEVEAWLRTISATEKWRDGILDGMGCKRFIQEYNNEWGFLAQSTTIPIIPINLIYAYTKTEIARLYFRDPWITVNAKRVEDLGASQIAEQIINYVWGELKLKDEIKRTLLEAILVGHSWIKVGYVAEFGTVESQNPEPTEKRGRGRPPKKVKDVMTNEYLKSENVFAYHVPYKNILFDPSATFPAPHNGRWMAQMIDKPLRAVKESGIYEHTDELRTAKYMQDDNKMYDVANADKDSVGKEIRSVRLYEIYDLDEMRVVTVSPGCKKYLKQMDYPKHLSGGFPFIQLAFNPVPGKVYPMSDVAAQEPLVVEMTKIVAIWLNHLKRWNRQIIIDNDAFPEEELKKFKDGIDGGIIRGNSGTKDKFFIPQYAPVQSDSYQIYNEAYKLYQIVSGQTPSDQGGQARVPTRTLGELRLQMMGGHARADEKVDVLEDFIAEIARKLLGIMQKKYDLLKIARIVGPRSIQQKLKGTLSQRPSAQPMTGQMPNQQPNPVANQSMTTDFSFSWNRQDILGEMDTDVVAGSTVPMDKESNLEVMEKMIPLLPAAGITPGSPAAKQYAREMFRIIGNQSLEAIMDLADQQQSPPPNPKLMETQAKVQGKIAETKVKIQGMQAQNQLKLQAQREKLQVDRQKHQLDMHKNVINTILQGVRASQAPAEGNGNGGF